MNIMRYLKLIALVASLAFVSCEDSVETTDNNVVEDNVELGYIDMTSFTLSVESQAESFTSDQTGDAQSVAASTRAGVEVDDLYVVITSVKYDTVCYKGTYEYLKGFDDVLPLYPGEYTIDVKSIEGGFSGTEWDTPYYSAYQSVTIVAKETTTPENMVCTLSNIGVAITLNASIKDLFFDGDEAAFAAAGLDYIPLEVVAELGSNSEEFSRTESRTAYFEAEQVENSLTITVNGYFNVGDEASPEYVLIEDWSEQVDGVRAGEIRNFLFAFNGVYDGTVEFELTIDKWVYNEDNNVDIMSVAYNFYSISEETVLDPDDTESHPDAPVLTYSTGQDIEDSFVINAESFNFDAESVVTPLSVIITPAQGESVASLTASVTSTNSNFIDALTAAGLDPSALDLLDSSILDEFITQRVDSSTGAVTITVKNSTMFSLYDLSGVHTFVVKALDSQERQSYTTLTIDISRLKVEWEGGYSFDERHTITNDLDVVINIEAGSGIKSLSVSIISDVLSAEMLTELDLSTYMELVSPDTEAMESRLNLLGFPTGSDVEGKEELTLDITSFMPVLANLGNDDFEVDFILGVSDGSEVIERTIMLYIDKSITVDVE